MAFQEEQVIARIRRSWWSLAFAFLALFLAATILSYVSNRSLEAWLMYLAYAVSAVLAVLFWLIPIVRHLNFYVELTTSRLIVRDGIFGQKTTELSLAEIVSIELGRARTISIGRKSGEVIRLPAMPRAKRLLAELRAAAPSGS